MPCASTNHTKGKLKNIADYSREPKYIFQKFAEQHSIIHKIITQQLWFWFLNQHNDIHHNPVLYRNQVPPYLLAGRSLMSLTQPTDHSIKKR